MTTIGEFIDGLRQLAGQLDQPDCSGLNAQVKLGWCGIDTLALTKEFDVEVCTFHKDDGGLDTFVLVRGHPHLDADSVEMRAPTADLDEELARLTNDDPERRD